MTDDCMFAMTEPQSLLIKALDLAEHPCNLYYEVRQLPTRTPSRRRMYHVIATLQIEQFGAIGMGDPGYAGIMHDRTIEDITYACFLPSEKMYEQIWPYDDGLQTEPKEVVMTGFISVAGSRPAFVSQFVWTHEEFLNSF